MGQLVRTRVVRTGELFTLFSGRLRIGKAWIKQARPGVYVLDAIYIHEPLQRKGYGTRLFAGIVAWLRDRGAVQLCASAEGSGTVQLFRRAFGDAAVYWQGGAELSYADAVRVMDVDFGRCRIEASFTAGADTAHKDATAHDLAGL